VKPEKIEFVSLKVSAAELRLAIFRSFTDLSGQKVGVLLTGDVPSAALYLASIDAGTESIAVLYRPRGRMVDSYRRSKDIVRFLGPPDAPILDVEYFSRETPYEAIAQAGRRHNLIAIASTHGVEGHFANAQEFHIYRRPSAVFDAFRASYFEYKRDASGGIRFRDLLRRYRVCDARQPFLSRQMREVCGRYSWDLLNKPRLYELIRRAFPEIDGIGL
jgi:hypothetical protein